MNLNDMSEKELRAYARSLEKKSGKHRKDEDYFRQKYPHADIVRGSLRFLPEESRQAVDIRCPECGKVRIVRTCDLHQVKKCSECTVAERAERRKAAKSNLRHELEKARKKIAELERGLE